MKGREILLCVCLILTFIIIIPNEESEAQDVSDIVINEFLARPNSDWDGDDIYDSSDDEWVELYNPTDILINVSGCFIGDSGSEREITGNGDILPHGFFIIYGSDYGSLSFNNAGDTVRFLDTDGTTVIDSYDFFSADQDVSEGREADGASSWITFESPTPGKRNYDEPPTIAFVLHTPLNPRSSNNVTIIANVSDDYRINFVNLSYSINGGDFTDVEMKDDGIYPDTSADDRNFTSQISYHVSGTTMRYYINCSDDNDQNTSWPLNAPTSYFSFAFDDEDRTVVINEFLADPGSDWDGDGWADYNDEWIELYNPRNTLVNLGSWKIDDTTGIGSPSYSIPFGMVIEPKDFLLFYRNSTEIALDNYGDNITLMDETDSIADIYPYTTCSNDVACGRFPDGTENWNDYLLPTPGLPNQYTVDSLENLSNIVINEFLPSPQDDYFTEWIELYNIGTAPVRLDGCWLDDALDFGGKPYQIPMNTSINGGQFWVLYENLSLNSEGDTINLLYVDGETMIDYHTYTSSCHDVAIGRFSDGTENWKGFLLPTPGLPNRYTVESLGNLSNIKINEFMPAPKTAYSTEWIELKNCGTTPVHLDGLWLDDAQYTGKKPWQIPLNTTIPPGGFYYINRSFGLNNAGDTVNLLYVDGITIIDSYSYESSEYDISFGRGDGGGDNWLSYSNPTPNGSNSPYQRPDSDERSILISELFYRGSDNCEFLSLYNPSNSNVDLSGWRIIDGQYSYSGTLIFPAGVTIPAQSRIFIAHNATVFFDIMGSYPEYEYGNSSQFISQMIRREEPGFANERDEVLLMDCFGNLIDIVVYGESEYEGEGWVETPITDAKKGEILRRNFDDVDNSYIDTNTLFDWSHMRHYKLGQSNFDLESFTYQGNLTMFASPDSSYETVVNEIGNAKKTIYISLYQFTNWNITEKIIQRLKDGVEVKILMEGGSVEGMIEEEKYVLSKIYENGGEVRFLVSNSTLSERYRYIHAKYAVIDNTSVIISSENWKYTGIPVNNTYGNRGWGVVIEDEYIAGYFSEVFFTDWEQVDYDLVHFSPNDPKYGNASSDFKVDDFIETGYYKPVFPTQTINGEYTIKPVLSPDTSLLEDDSILGLMDSATRSIYIEQLDIAVNWNDGDIEYENLYLKAALQAAEKRHVDVKILLSSKYTFPDDPNLDNYDTFIYINNYAENHNISECLEARLVNYDRLGVSKIHNKGMIVDGNKTLISSINWNRNSVTQNREVGVIIENEEVAEYFTKMFLWDWNEPPVADAGDDITINATQEVQFNDLSQDIDNNIVSYFWDFDDGTNSTEQNPHHTYEKEGIYVVRLTITDGQYSDSQKLTVYVIEPEIEGQETDMIIMTALMFVFLIIIMVIIAFIRKMRLQFI